MASSLAKSGPRRCRSLASPPAQITSTLSLTGEFILFNFDNFLHHTIAQFPREAGFFW